ncbi:MAG: hypothetical protein AAB606_04930 [Patescibacteria group bacterium]
MTFFAKRSLSRAIPTEDIEAIKKHAADVGMVLAGYEMTGADVPPAIDAMHFYLQALLCISLIKFVEDKIEQGSVVSPEIQHVMVLADDAATPLARGYKDATLLNAVNALKERLGGL